MHISEDGKYFDFSLQPTSFFLLLLLLLNAQEEVKFTNTKPKVTSNTG